VLLTLYHDNVPITAASIQEGTDFNEEWLETWMSIMQLENVINPVPGHEDLYSLLQTHHTVNMVADRFGVIM
jgi:hypothetical protein